MKKIMGFILLLLLNNFLSQAQNLPKVNGSNSLEAFQGQLAGLKITPGKDVGSSPNVLIRGINTWNNNDPLFVIDGLQTQDVQVFNSINPNDIKSVSVIKGPSAAIYGSRGANGVIIVKTKAGGRNYSNVKSVHQIKKKKNKKKNKKNKKKKNRNLN